ncbi:MAG: hypothetical protein H0U00_11440 [Actinobacteria bacterium]|nr:hypothetical protein [Actinomycetota bacterium]
MTAIADVWTDPELRQLILEEPELMAVADALAQAGPAAVSAPRRRLRLRPARASMVAAALAIATALALVAPWSRSGSGSLSDLALAAIGSQPVLHVIAQSPAGAQLIDLQSGDATPVIQQEEIWYDADRGLRRDVVRVGQTIIGDTLETPRGGYTPGGIVYDCTWIAAHPVEATKAGVSCNASGDNGMTPRVVPRPKPTLDPGLAGFVDGYRQALANGSGQRAGAGFVDRQPVDWLTFKTGDGSERVALDQTTHKPVLLENDSGWSLRITTIETIAFTASDFRRPTPDELPAQPSHGRAADVQTLPLDGAAIAAEVPAALWAGPTLAGVPLVKAEQQALRATFADGAAPQTGTGLELEYGVLGTNGRLDLSQPHVRIQQAQSRELGFASMWGFVRGDAPPPGTLYAPIMNGGNQRAFGADGKPLPPSPPHLLGFTVPNGRYVTIEASSNDLLLAAARTLKPVER